MPTWATILVAVVSGLGAGTVGTFLSIAHERGAELRTRRLDAAAAFLDAANHLRRTVVRPASEGEVRSRLAEVRFDDLVQETFKIELLFGRDSVPAQYARTVGGWFWDVIEAHKTDEDADSAAAKKAAARESVQHGISYAVDYLRAFAPASSDAVWDRRWRRRINPRDLGDYMPDDWVPPDERPTDQPPTTWD
jgi:hypothetical protein